MIVVNKCVNAHSSTRMINKYIAIANSQPLQNIEDANEQRRLHRPLLKGKRRTMGLSVKEYKDKNDYNHALKLEQEHIDNEIFKEFVAEQVNGGFAWDEPNFMI